MPAINLKSSDRSTISGLPGTGKTTLSKYLCTIAEPNLLIYDPLDQYRMFDDTVRYVPKTDSMDEFEAICKGLCQRSNVVFVIEEAEKYLQQGKVMGPYAFDVINRGRNWGIGVIAVTRRIQRLSKDYFDLCKHVFFFKCGLRSYDYIEEMTSRQTIQAIRSLQKFHFLHKDLETEEETICYLELKKRLAKDDVDVSQMQVVEEKPRKGPVKPEKEEE